MKKLLSGLLVVIASFLLIYKFDTRAESLPTNLTVGNSPPSFTVGPTADPISGILINEGTDLTFTATANEPNGEGYYLAVCSGSITPGSGGSAPTCDSFTLCISSLTNSNSEASCQDTVDDSYSGWSTSWSVYVCDDNSTSSECSMPTMGYYYINHDPTFTAIADDGGSGADSGADPGGTMTFTATASDSDNNPQPDSDDEAVKLFVCADNTGATSSGCNGTQLCSSSFVTSNPSCNYSIPSVAQDGDFNYYAHVFDFYGDLGSFSNPQTGTYTINNVAPTVSGVTINGGLNIYLTENTTTDVIVTGTVTDNNSCQDLVTVEASVYRSGVTYSGCDTDAEDDDDSCYAQVSCSVSGGSCSGPTDATVDYTCTVPVQYHADPTTANTQFPTHNWRSTINAIDSALSDNTEVAAGVQLNTLNAMDIGATVNYGNTQAGYVDSSVLDTMLLITSTGNIGMDLELSGTDMTDGGSGTIGVNNQRFAFYCPMQSYNDDGITLNSTATEEEINIRKTTDIYNSMAQIYWGIYIPTDTSPGIYSGTNTIVSVLGETANWDDNGFGTCGPVAP